MHGPMKVKILCHILASEDKSLRLSHNMNYAS